MSLTTEFNFGINNFGLSFEIVSDKGAARHVRNKGSFAWGGYWGTTFWAAESTPYLPYYDATNSQQPQRFV